MANRYVFPDPNYNSAIGIYLRDLDSKIAYFGSIRSYYPTQESWDSVVNQMRQNYLTALNTLVGFATLTGGTSGSASGGSTVGSGTAGQATAAVATKRIIATFSNGHRYSWRYYPASGGLPARVVSEGRMQ